MCDSTLEQALNSQMISFIGEDRDLIVELLVDADFSKKLDLATDHQEETAINLESFISKLLYYSLEDFELREAFLEFMPSTFFDQVPEMRQTKHPSDILCNRMASIIVSYQDTNYICKSFLAKLEKSNPDTFSKISISDI